MKPLLPFFLLISLSLGLSAQQTGSFQLTVAFSEADYNFTRDLYYFVPSDYDPGQSYPLVVGFRGGPHTDAGQFRNQLSFLADSIGAIILCPENSGHFWNEEGLTKQLFQYSVDTTMTMYNIDPDYIYLTGLSYGGRHAVIVAMDTDDGVIPQLRGVIPFAAGTDSQLQPNYDAIDDFAPACICIGLNDSDNFINVANTLHSDIEANGGNAMLNEIAGVGHTVAFSSYPVEMMECLQYIESFYPVTNVVEPGLGAEIELYPNPVSDQLQLRIPQDWKIDRLYLINALGQKLLDMDTEDRIFDTSSWPVGSLWLVLEKDGSKIVKPIVHSKN